MLLMYCYSSYKYSPIGFALGYLEVPITDNSEFAELKPCDDDFVRKCFETGFIKHIYGKNPRTEHYIFMEKKLVCEFINEDGKASKKNCNFMFEFDNVEEYKNFKKNFNRNQLEMYMNDFIIPDSSVENYALKINSKAFNDYIELILNKKTNDETLDIECEELYFETLTSSSENCQKLSEIVGSAVNEWKPFKYSTRKALPAINDQDKKKWLIMMAMGIVSGIMYKFIHKSFEKIRKKFKKENGRGK